MTPEDSQWAETLLRLHSHKLAGVRDRGDDANVYLLHAVGGTDDRAVPLDASFVRFTRAEASTALDTTRRSVDFLLRHQMVDCDTRTHLLAGVVLPSGDVVVHSMALAKGGGVQRSKRRIESSLLR